MAARPRDIVLRSIKGIVVLLREALKRAEAGKPLREITLSYAVDHSTISRLKGAVRC